MSTIIVIDDDPEFQEAIQKVLSGAGYSVLRADDGTSGVQLLEKQHKEIDLAIVDLSLPGINGFEIIGAISRRPTGVKVIATTGVYGESHLEAAGSLGAHALIRKPASVKNLPAKEWLDTVRQLIGPATRGTTASA
jgi:CheY-like chemotaxis protein